MSQCEFSTLYGTAELSADEQQELDAVMALLPQSDQQAIRAGVQCLPKAQQGRAALEWCQRWEVN